MAGDLASIDAGRCFSLDGVCDSRLSSFFGFVVISDY